MSTVMPQLTLPTTGASAGRGTIDRLADTDAHEGPVHAAAGQAPYFTPRRAGRRVDIMRLSLPDGRISTVLADAGAANGMALDHDGRLLVCEQQPAAVSRVAPATGAGEDVVGD